MCEERSNDGPRAVQFEDGERSAARDRGKQKWKEEKVVKKRLTKSLPPSTLTTRTTYVVTTGRTPEVKGGKTISFQHH